MKGLVMKGFGKRSIIVKNIQRRNKNNSFLVQ